MLSHRKVPEKFVNLGEGKRLPEERLQEREKKIQQGREILENSRIIPSYPLKNGGMK